MYRLGCISLSVCALYARLGNQGFATSHVVHAKGEHMTFSKPSVRRILAGLTGLATGSAGWATAMGTLAIATATPAAACNMEPYIGSICTFALDYCPREYLPADGRTLTVNTDQALFSLIGYRYGGDNGDHFAIPDLRGRTVIGQGTGPGLGNIALAKQVGQQAVLLSESQVPLRTHTHSAVFTGTGGGKNQVNVPASPGSLAITSKLQAIQAPGAAQPETGLFLGMGGNGNQQAPIYAKSTKTTTAVDLAGLEVKLTGTEGHGPINFDIQTGITGGVVTVEPTHIGATQNVSTQSPGLGMTVCIARIGLYPQRP